MRREVLLSAFLLAGCWSPGQRVTDCMFGAQNSADAETCAVRNFGEAGAAYMKQRDLECAVSVDRAWIAANCPKDKDNFPKAEEPPQCAGSAHFHSNSNLARKG